MKARRLMLVAAVVLLIGALAIVGLGTAFAWGGSARGPLGGTGPGGMMGGAIGMMGGNGRMMGGYQ